MTGKPKVVTLGVAGEDHQVVRVEGARGEYRRRPCAPCPWRRDNVGEFPAEAFRLAAPGTAYDMSDATFGCHESDAMRTQTCAGFLLSTTADNNLSVRLGQSSGRLVLDDVHGDGAVLFAYFADMAIANGVDPDDPVLALCV